MTPMMNSTPSISDHLLQSSPLLFSSDVDEVRTKVAGELSEHRLEPRAPALKARLFGAKAEGVQVYRLEYGAAVSVDARLGSDTILVQYGLQGRIDARSPFGQWQVAPGQALIFPPGVSVHLEWQEHAAQLLVKISLARLNRAYESLVGAMPMLPLRLRQARVYDTASAPGWDALLGYFCSQLFGPGGRQSTLSIKVAEDALMGHLLCSRSLCLVDGAMPPPSGIAPRHVRRAREFMEDRIQEAISLEDIAAYAGVSVRSLSRAYQAQYGASPMAALRTLRLEKIRQDLADPGAESSIADIAFRWGYAHLGRFAAAYRERFGEPPHETLRRARQAPPGLPRARPGLR